MKMNAPWVKKSNSENVVYIFPIEGNLKDNVYIGISALNGALRWYNHKQSFTNLLLKNQTALSKYYWALKDRGLILHIK